METNKNIWSSVEIEHDHIATGSESLLEYARNAGQDQPDRCWLLDPRDVWVRNPHFTGTDTTHPDDDDGRPEPSWQDLATYSTESICDALRYADFRNRLADEPPFTLF